MNPHASLRDAFPARGAGEGRQRWAVTRSWWSPIFAGTHNARLNSACRESSCGRFGLS